MQVLYSGWVTGSSPAGFLVRFRHEGIVTTAGTDTSVTIKPLTPGTSYTFRVSAVSTRGEGMEIGVNATTASARLSFGESFSYIN
jgi:hypothetical protein